MGQEQFVPLILENHDSRVRLATIKLISLGDEHRTEFPISVAKIVENYQKLLR